MWLVQLKVKQPPEQMKQEWLESHNRRNQSLRDAGVIVANGLLADGSGGCILYNCESGEIEQLINEDPLVKIGVADYQCSEWEV